MRLRKVWFDLHTSDVTEPDVAIVGLPFDGSASLKAGAAGAPAKLREISRTSDPITRRGARIQGTSVQDFGDIPLAGRGGRPLPQPEYLESAYERLSSLPERSFVLTLGGDNSVTIPALRRFMRVHGPKAGVIWFDAHPDLFESYDGNPDSHACALHRSMATAGIDPRRVMLLGARSFSEEEATRIAHDRIEVVTAADWAAAGPGADGAGRVAGRIAARLDGCPAIFLALDIDGFDASAAPGTGYPMPGGPSSEEFFSVMERLFEALPIRGMDLTEIAPSLDTNDRTSFLGAQVVLEALGALSRMKPSAPPGR